MIESKAASPFVLDPLASLGQAEGGPLEVLPDSLRWQQRGLEIRVQGQRPEELAKQLTHNLEVTPKEGDFAVKTTVIEEVKKKLGEPDKTDWVPAAKGTYVTYSDQALVFGFNKGMQIFEVRSFDQKLQKVALAKTKEVYGAPAYDVKVNGEEIIGYTAGQEFKIERVFPEPTQNIPNPLLDHYLVLYLQGTVNSMANDSGRQW